MTQNIEVLTHWIQGCLVVAAFFTTAFPVLYAFFPWRSTRLGKVLMLQGIAFALVLDMTVLFQFWAPSNILVLFWVEALGFAFVALTTGALSWLMIAANRSRHRRKVKDGGLPSTLSFVMNAQGGLMSDEYVPQHLAGGDPEAKGSSPLLTNSAYDTLKMGVQVWLPGLGALYAALAGFWGFPHPLEVVGTIAAVSTFLGLILGISTKQYNNSDEKFDGEIDVVDNGDGTGMVNLHPTTHPAEFSDRKEVTFKVNPS